MLIKKKPTRRLVRLFYLYYPPIPIESEAMLTKYRHIIDYLMINYLPDAYSIGFEDPELTEYVEAVITQLTTWEKLGMDQYS